MTSLTIAGVRFVTTLYFRTEGDMFRLIADILIHGNWNKEDGHYMLQARSGLRTSTYYTDKLEAGAIKVLTERARLWQIAQERMRLRAGEWVWGHVNDSLRRIATLSQMRRLQTELFTGNPAQ